MNQRFGAYVQSVAFQLTLSRNMIEALGLVRDIGTVHDRGKETATRRRLRVVPSPHVTSYSIPIARALERRGLVEFWADVLGDDAYNDRNGYFQPGKVEWVYRLTRAGELTCELLVEAGLLPAARREKKKKDAA